MRYFIIAGEASGDLHGGNLMRGLYSVDSQAVIRFYGGERMESAFRSCRRNPGPDEGKAHDYREGAVMGAVEILAKAGSLLRSLSRCKKQIRDFRPDAVILVDYPGFNLRIAKWAHRAGFKVFYYIAPKVWASREGRIKAMKRDIDRLFIIFPFEKEYFKSKDMPFFYCGNPLVESITSSPAISVPREELRAGLGFTSDSRIVAMLAGSRPGEIKTMMPVFAEVAANLHSRKEFSDCEFVVAGAPGRTKEDYGRLPRGMRLVFGKTSEILRAADAAVINSGTASLEAVLTDTPQVVAYKFPFRLTYWLAKHFFFKAKFISLGNLCLDRLVFKEFYRLEDCNASNLAEETARLLTDDRYIQRMRGDYTEIRRILGGDGASLAAAGEMYRLLTK